MLAYMENNSYFQAKKSNADFLLIYCKLVENWQSKIFVK